MKIEEFREVVVGDVLYARGNCRHKGLSGTVLDVYLGKAMLQFEDGVYWYSYMMLSKEPPLTYDYEGYITKNNLLRNDGLIFTKDTFRDCDCIKVPIVWRGEVNKPDCVLGNALLINRKDGVYAKLIFNRESELATAAMNGLVETGEFGIGFSANRVDRQHIKHGELVKSGVILAVHVDFEGVIIKYTDCYIDVDAELEEAENEHKKSIDEMREEVLEQLRNLAEFYGYELVKKAVSR